MPFGRTPRRWRREGRMREGHGADETRGWSEVAGQAQQARPVTKAREHRMGKADGRGVIHVPGAGSCGGSSVANRRGASS